MPAKLDAEAFLWDPEKGTIGELRWSPRDGAWWARLCQQLEASGQLTNSGLHELTQSSRLACSLLPNPAAWPSEASISSGLVVGAVQSGKTQHMMALAARALDNGYDLVVVLAGQTNDLRQQTARRFNGPLCQVNEKLPNRPGQTTLGGIPGPQSDPAPFVLPFSTDAHDYSLLPIRLRKAVQTGHKTVLVIKKHASSLAAVGKALHSCATFDSSKTTHVLVLDDECDEASVPGNTEDTVIPDAIGHLLGAGRPCTRMAYLGYTATAAAALLQQTKSVLYPETVQLIRSPGQRESQFCYEEPVADNWYCGGETYFESFGSEAGEDANFLIRNNVDEADLVRPPLENTSLLDALRAFVVAGAFRLALTGSESAELAHTFMVHTSASMGEHKRYGKAIEQFLSCQDRDECQCLRHDLMRDSAAWESWFLNLAQSRQRVHELRPHQGGLRPLTWGQVHPFVDAVIRRCEVRVVNSSDDAADQLDYSPSYGSNGERIAPTDQIVAVVGGARLARGLTIEGLTTCYFTRDAAVRYEDALLQMNRWFGYRGQLLDFTRILTTESTFADLRNMAENDTLLRQQLADLMERNASPKEAAVVMRSSPYAKPTAKMGAGQELTISYSPFLKLLGHADIGEFGRANEQVAERLVHEIHQRNPSEVWSEFGNLRGIVSCAWTSLEVADWLDQLQFAQHNPEPHDELHGAYHRPLDRTREPGQDLTVSNDPYLIAAYLRKWNDHDSSTTPVFNVGISYGGAPADPLRFDFPLVERQITSHGEMIGGWTGRSEGWPGDQKFDIDPSSPELHQKLRLAGSPGLLLLYLVHRESQGKSGSGVTRSHHTPYFGISIPAGGPQESRVITPPGVVRPAQY